MTHQEHMKQESEDWEKKLLRLPVTFWKHTHPAEYKILITFIRSLLTQQLAKRDGEILGEIKERISHIIPKLKNKEGEIEYNNENSFVSGKYQALQAVAEYIKRGKK